MANTELDVNAFQQGKLYQVYTHKKWIIAEYLKTVPAYNQESSGFNLSTLKFSPVRIQKIPTSHLWKSVVGGYNYSTVAKDTQTRPVTDETLAAIAQLKAEIKQCDLDRVALLNELKELTL